MQIQAIKQEEIDKPKSGQIHLVFELVRERTRLIDCYQTPPLKASRTLYTDGDQKATVFLMESSGGMVAGDSNGINIHVKNGGGVCIKPQSATKIYPSFNLKPCSQSISIILDANSELEWNHDELIPFKNAIFHSTNIIRMSAEATLIWGEIIYPGREKRGEHFQFNELKTKFEIWVDGNLIVYDSIHLLPKKQNLQEIGVLENFNYVGTVWFISPKAYNLNEVLLVQQFQQSSEHQSGVSRLNREGIMVRWLSNNLPLLKKEMVNVFELLKKEEFFIIASI